MSVPARKIAALLRCVDRARSEHAQAGQAFERDLTRQDAAILNITRACEAAIDLACMVVRTRKLGVPGEAREGFQLMERNGILLPGLSLRMQRMIGFRNIAVRQYLELDINIMESVIRTHLDDMLAFAEIVRAELAE